MSTKNNIDLDNVYKLIKNSLDDLYTYYAKTNIDPDTSEIYKDFEKLMQAHPEFELIKSQITNYLNVSNNLKLNTDRYDSIENGEAAIYISEPELYEFFRLQYAQQDNSFELLGLTGWNTTEIDEIVANGGACPVVIEPTENSIFLTNLYFRGQRIPVERLITANERVTLSSETPVDFRNIDVINKCILSQQPSLPVIKLFKFDITYTGIQAPAFERKLIMIKDLLYTGTDRIVYDGRGYKIGEFIPASNTLNCNDVAHPEIGDLEVNAFKTTEGHTILTKDLVHWQQLPLRSKELPPVQNLTQTLTFMPYCDKYNTGCPLSYPSCKFKDPNCFLDMPAVYADFVQGTEILIDEEPLCQR